MNDIIVIGYGNALRGDDGVALHVIREIQMMYSKDNIRYLSLHQLGPELAEMLCKASHVIFIDASVSGTSGAITRTVLSPSILDSPLNHYLTPESLLSLTYSLYGTVAKGILYDITGQSFDFSESLSGVVQRKIPELVMEIHTYLQSIES